MDSPSCFCSPGDSFFPTRSTYSQHLPDPLAFAAVWVLRLLGFLHHAGLEWQELLSKCATIAALEFTKVAAGFVTGSVFSLDRGLLIRPPRCQNPG